MSLSSSIWSSECRSTSNFELLLLFLSFCFCKMKSLFVHRADPGSGNLVTFAQFAFIALEGFINTAKFGREPLKISFNSYTILVVMFFIASVCNNYAFDFNIPMPLHMIFRAVSFQISYAINKWLLLLLVESTLKWLPSHFTGISNRKHDHGNSHSAETLWFLEICIRIDDNAGHHHLHNHFWQQCGKRSISISFGKLISMKIQIKFG